MTLCPHCNNEHDNFIEQALCPLRPEQVPLNVKMFGNRASYSDYRISDRVRFIENSQEYTGVILWTIAPGESGTHVEPAKVIRYVVERDNHSDEWYAVPQSAILGYVARGEK